MPGRAARMRSARARTSPPSSPSVSRTKRTSSPERRGCDRSLCALVSSMPGEHDAREERGREPHPPHLARQDGEAVTRHERTEPDRRDGYGAHRKEVAGVAEGREERHAETAVGHGVEAPVRCGGNEEV